MRKKAEQKSPGLMAGVSGGGSRVVKEDGRCEEEIEVKFAC